MAARTPNQRSAGTAKRALCERLQTRRLTQCHSHLHACGAEFVREGNAHAGGVPVDQRKHGQVRVGRVQLVQKGATGKVGEALRWWL